MAAQKEGRVEGVHVVYVVPWQRRPPARSECQVPPGVLISTGATDNLGLERTREVGRRIGKIIKQLRVVVAGKSGSVRV